MGIDMDLFNVVSLIVGLVGLGGTLYFGLKSTKLQKRLRRFEWSDVEIGVKYLAKKAKTLPDPDIILTISAPGGIVASLFVIHRPELTPLYSGITLKKDDPRSLALQVDHHILATSKWRIAIPEALLRNKDSRVLVFDDAVVTGDAMSNVLNLLTERGFARAKVTTAALITTDAAIRSEKGPDLYWLNVSDFDVYLPWGHMMGPGY
jgi:hypoxanthine phosphoribosyltransferase